MSIVLAVALIALHPQEQTLTFTHSCDRASVVLEALGEELGVALKKQREIYRNTRSGGRVIPPTN